MIISIISNILSPYIIPTATIGLSANRLGAVTVYIIFIKIVFVITPRSKRPALLRKFLQLLRRVIYRYFSIRIFPCRRLPFLEDVFCNLTCTIIGISFSGVIFPSTSYHFTSEQFRNITVGIYGANYFKIRILIGSCSTLKTIAY